MSPLGAFINTAADNLRGQGANIRDTVIKLSQAFSALGDHSTDIFCTVKNLSILVSALQDSTDLMRQLNQNLASVTGLLADNPERGRRRGQGPQRRGRRCAELRRPTTARRSAPRRTSWPGSPQALNDSLDDVKQVLHVAPNTFQNFMNIYQPAQGAVSGVLAVNNFANPITFLCGAIQAASRLGAEQSAKLCVQYLAPIIKNRQYNFPPLGVNLFVGATARPNEITYSEDWMRPDYVPPQPPPTARSRRRPAGAAARRRRWAAAGGGGAGCRDRIRPTACTGMMVPPGGRTMMRAQGRCAWRSRVVVWRWRLSGCGDWRGLNSLPLPGTAGQRAGRVHHPGADARCGQHRTELAGPGRRRERRQRHQDRAPGLACVGDHAAQRRRPPARQRDRQARPDQPAGFAAHRAGAADRRAAARASCTTAR